MGILSFNRDLCARDGACIDVCPYSLIRRDGDGFPIEVAEAETACIRCGHCVAVCPVGGLTNSLMDKDAFQEAAALDRADAVAFAMRTRRSTRVFLPEDLPAAELKAMFEVLRLAPTANNTQKLWWIVTTGREQTRQLAELAAAWMHKAFFPEQPRPPWGEGGDPVLRGAPHLALCCAPEEYSWAATDAAIAVASLDLLAASRGLGTCWAGVFLRAAWGSPELAEALALPEGQKIYGGLMLGRPKHQFRLVPPRKPAAVNWR